MRAFLTGAGGFCGKHLLRYLKNADIDAYYVTRHPAKTEKERYLPDVTNVEALSEIIKEIQPDYVFHLAGISYSTDPNLYYRINTEYAVTLFHALAHARLRHVPVLLVGTSAEYGMVSHTDLPIDEDLRPRPYDHYSISKLAQTLEGLAAVRNGHAVVIARPFNVIGTGMPEHLVVQTFARQLATIIKNDEAPIIYVGNLNASRDFLDVEDLVESYWKLIQTPAAYGEIVNVCSGQGTFIKDILSELIELSGHKVEVRFDRNRFKGVDVPEHYGSNKKLKRLTGTVPTRTLRQSLNAIWSDLIGQE